MKSFVLLLISVLAFSICSVKSQFPNQKIQSPTNMLQEIKANNDVLIDRQKAAIRTLDGMQEMSRQIKIFSKRA